MAIKLHPFIGDSVTNGRCIMNTNRNTTGSNTTFFQVLLCWNSVLEVVYWQVLSVGYRPDCNKLKIGEKGGVDGLPFCLEVSSSQAPTWRYCQQITFITHNGYCPLINPTTTPVLNIQHQVRWNACLTLYFKFWRCFL